MYQNKEILTMTKADYAKGKIPVDVFKDADDVFRHIARYIADEIKSYNGKKAVMIMPLGPVGQYKYLSKIVNDEQISLKNITFINMDEYMWDETTLIEKDNPLSFEFSMYKEFYNNVDEKLIMPKSQRIFPTPTNGAEIREIIAKNGGVDLCIGGIGIDGHIAFNEPPQDDTTDEEFKNLSVRVIKILTETIITNGIYEFEGAYEFMPHYAVTIGFKEILSAKKIRLYTFKPFHKMVVRKACFYPQSASFPVTLLQGTDIRIGTHEIIA
ncbi:MAG: glucosamine-6-phosphate isomerase [Clostridia bacterium]